MKKKWGHTDKQTNKHTNDTHPGRIIVPDGIYSVGDKNKESPTVRIINHDNFAGLII